MHISFEQISEMFTYIGIENSAAESHGILIGLLCMEVDASFEIWLSTVFEEKKATKLKNEKILQALQLIHTDALNMLNDVDLGFEPCLPGDTITLVERIFALEKWCHGFLTGLALGGIGQLPVLPGDSEEIMQDLGMIAKATMLKSSENNEDESNYSEILEYVRTAVLLLREEFTIHKSIQNIKQKDLH